MELTIFRLLLITIIGIVFIKAVFMVKPSKREIPKPIEEHIIVFPEGFSMSTKGVNGIQGNRRGEVIIITSLPLGGEP